MSQEISRERHNFGLYICVRKNGRMRWNIIPPVKGKAQATYWLSAPHFFLNKLF